MLGNEYEKISKYVEANQQLKKRIPCYVNQCPKNQQLSKMNYKIKFNPMN